MPDKKKNEYSEEEYKLSPEEEYVTPEAQAEPESSAYGFTDEPEEVVPTKKRFAVLQIFSYLPQMRNKRILMIIGLILFLLLLFHFLHKPDQLPKPAQPVQKQQEVAAPAPAPAPQPVAPVVQQPDMSAEMANAMQTHASQTQTKFNDLETQLTNMQSNLTASQTTNESLQQSVTALKNQVDALRVQVSHLSHSLRRPPALGPSIIYHIHAILPDRAWLVSNAGQTVTVTLGNTLADYGVVQAIDPEQGIIYTSSGRKIYYGENDF